MNSIDVSPSATPSAADQQSAPRQSPEENPWSESPLKGVAGKARRAAGTAASRVKEKAGELAADQKDAAARNVERYGSTLHDSAKSMEAEDPNIAHFAHRAADQLEKAAAYIRNSDMNRIRQDAENVARGHPALFMGGMLAAGLVLGALVKGSTQSLRENSQAYDGDAGGRDGDDTRGQSTPMPEPSVGTPEGKPEVLPGEVPSPATPGASAGNP